MTVSEDYVDATPRKRLFYSIISDYNLSRGLCELIDNALDVAKRADRPHVTVDLEVDARQQSITVIDDGGGIPRDDLRVIVSPGDSLNDEDGATIGYFGVGTKRAVVALAQHVVISSRVRRENGNQVRIDDAWLQDDDWRLKVDPASDVTAGTTRIELCKLRVEIGEDVESVLHDHLGRTYCAFLTSGLLKIKLNGAVVHPIDLAAWAYPPHYEPRRVVDTIFIGSESDSVQVEVIGGLMLVSSPAGDYGVYLYCNDRLVAQAVTTGEVGFSSGVAGQPHPSVSRTRVVVSVSGPAKWMPWNSSKSDINYNSDVFRTLRPLIQQSVKHWAQLSRRLAESDVAPYTRGQIITETEARVDTIPKSYLPGIPMRRRVQRAEQLAKLNARLMRDKPWVLGLNDALIAIDAIGRDRRIEQPERIQLILLDSTLEIAFKEYLVNETDQGLSDKRLVELFSARPTVQQEVEKYLHLSDRVWKQIDFYHRLRNKLIHERSFAGIRADQVAQFQRVVEDFLRRAFGLRVPQDQPT